MNSAVRMRGECKLVLWVSQSNDEQFHPFIHRRFLHFLTSSLPSTPLEAGRRPPSSTIVWIAASPCEATLEAVQVSVSQRRCRLFVCPKPIPSSNTCNLCYFILTGSCSNKQISLHTNRIPVNTGNLLTADCMDNVTSHRMERHRVTTLVHQTLEHHRHTRVVVH